MRNLCFGSKADVWVVGDNWQVSPRFWPLLALLKVGSFIDFPCQEGKEKLILRNEPRPAAVVLAVADPVFSTSSRVIFS